MSPYNALTVSKQLQSESDNQSDAISTDESQILKDFTLKLCLTTLIATVLCLPSFSRSAYSADLKFPNQSTQNKQNSFSTLLPRIIGFLPNPLKNLANLSQAPSNATSQNSLVKAKTQPHSSSAEKLPLRRHLVKSGDTLFQIAQQYQVNQEELIKINLIGNSDLILVDQQLTIPQNTVSRDKPSTTDQSSSKLADTKTIKQPSETSLATINISNVVSSEYQGVGGESPSKKMAKLDEDPYIAGLRADIEKLRAEYRQQRLQQESNAPNSKKVPKELDNNFNSQLSMNGDTVNEEQKNDNVATSLPNSQNLKQDLFAEDNVALQLPPLSSPEAYLPSTFDGYTWPAKGVLTSGYGWRWGRLHGGIDIAAPVGTPILAAASGEVISSGWNNGGYGNLIELEHLDGSITRYAHNNKLLVSAGQRVTKGEQIAEMGSTGYSTGPHLHFEIHPKSQGAANPLAYLK